MGKALYIAEKPSVAMEFAKALKINAGRRDGYMESDEAVITWCVGHLVTMLRKWTHFYLKTVLSTISAPSDFIMKFIYPTQEGLPLKSAKP